MDALADPAALTRIGRFDIVRELGRGSQGTVYLASDTHLGRAVALKTLRLEAVRGAAREQQVRTLLDEARIVGSLQHPNIVTLHDAGEDSGQPFLVFEYVEGRTLKAFIRENGPIAPARAAEITLQILQGIGHAHSRNVLHRDLKPDNVMLTKEGVARVMDFGIASQSVAARPGETALCGTPAYMAPEYIAKRVYTKASDLFSLGMVLYEMLTGKRAVQGKDVTEVLHKISNLALQPPSNLQPKVNERLDSIVATALARKPEERYSDTGAMAAALTDWLYPAAEVSGESKQATLDFLLRRMRHKSDLPALSSTINSINKVVAGEHDHASVLCNSILHDVSLTGKLLRLVNTAFYNQFGGSVSTVSRAVSILGFDRVRNIALSLVLFEHLHNKAQASSLKDEVVASYLSAVVACQMVEKIGIRDAEEVFICAMFHRLGKLLVSFYLYDEMEAITRLMQARDLDEESATRQVLGLEYAEIGQGVARDWNLPEVIVSSMEPLRDKVKGRTAFEKDKLRAISDFACGLTDLVRESDADLRHAGLQRLAAKFGGALPVNEKSLLVLMDESVKSLARDADFMGFGAGKSQLIADAKAWTDEAPKPDVIDAKDDIDEDDIATLVEMTHLGDTDAEQTSELLVQDSAERRRTVLAAGVQDITNTLVGEYQLNDILHIILETMYRGIGFKRVMMCIRDSKRNVLRSRFGFGDDVDRLIVEGFAVPLGEDRDIFYAALRQGVDICIENLDAENIRRHVPDWYRSVLSPHGLILFPILIKKRAVALIYADAEDPALLRFAPEELSMLKTLRNQAVLAIKQNG